MRIFGITQARHYCGAYSPEGGDAEGSATSFFDAHLATRKRVREGQSVFSQYRACSLRDAERNLFLSASHYRRCLDLMLPSASPWAHVTVYYGAWFAAHALLPMFGCAVVRRSVIDVGQMTPGRQSLRIRRIGSKPGQEASNYGGSHQNFWDLFYRAVVPLRQLVAPTIAFALKPVSQDPVWQIERRNEVNYDSLESMTLARAFDVTFSKAAFPASLPGALATQFQIFEGLLELTFAFAKKLGLQTDGVSQFWPGPLRHQIAAQIYGTQAPGLLRQTKKALVV